MIHKTTMKHIRKRRIFVPRPFPISLTPLRREVTNRHIQQRTLSPLLRGAFIIAQALFFVNFRCGTQKMRRVDLHGELAPLCKGSCREATEGLYEVTFGHEAFRCAKHEVRFTHEVCFAHCRQCRQGD